MDVEQTQTTETTQAPAEQDAGDVTDAQLIAAAQEAGGVEAVQAEQAAEGKPAPVAAAADPAAVEEPKIAALIRAREKAFQERKDAEDWGAQRRQQAEQEAAKILADARAKAATDYESDLAARRARFRATPGAAIRELGSPDEIVDAVTREGTAEWKAIRAAEERAERAEAKAASVDVIKADFDAFKNQMARDAAQAQLAAVEHNFITNVASPEKAPTLHSIAAQIPNVPGAVRGPAAVVAWGHALAAEWARAGVPFAHADVAEYLEHQARTGALGGTPVVPVPPQQVSGGGSGQKVRPNGSRTLSAANGSERRAAPKPIEEMSPDEERQALIEAAAEARRTTGG